MQLAAPQRASIDSLPEWHDADRHLSYVGPDNECLTLQMSLSGNQLEMKLPAL
jgi:hypothetical protein